MPPFKLDAPFKPCGDQAQAIDKLTAGVKAGKKHQVLLGVTGSGKTFTMANLIEQVQKPTLVLVHNKTLAGQLYHEFKQFFPAECSRILHQLLRLLSARSLHSAVGYVYCQRCLHQRRDRSNAACRDTVIVAAKRCVDRVVGVLHLRSRVARSVP